MFKRIKKCPNCDGRVKKQKKLNQECYHKDETIIVPNVTAFVCESCGSRYFDWKSIQYIKNYVNSLNESDDSIDEEN